MGWRSSRWRGDSTWCGRQWPPSAASQSTIFPCPPVWLGGRLEVVRRLAAEVADGWNGWGGDQARFAEEAAQVRGWASHPMTVSWGGAVLLARDSDELEQLVSRRGGTEGVVAGTPDKVAGVLAGLVEAGADELVLSLLPSNRPQPTWELFMEKVWPRLG